METSPSSPGRRQKIIYDIKLRFLNRLNDQALYTIDPIGYSKNKRDKLISYLADVYDLDDLLMKIVSDPDIYETEYFYELYDNAIQEMLKNGIEPNIVKEMSESLEQENELVSKAQKRVNRMQDPWVKEYEKERKGEDFWDFWNVEDTEKKKKIKSQKNKVDEWVEDYNKTILDFFITPQQRKIVQEYLGKLNNETKKQISNLVKMSKSMMNTEEQRKEIAKMIRNKALGQSKY
jgi:ferritin-like protein